MKRLHSLLKGGMGAEVDWQILRGAITRSYKRRAVLCQLMIFSQRIIASNVILDDRLKPSQLVTLACKRVDSSIVGSKLIREELNERAYVFDAPGPRGEGVYVTTVHQDLPNAPMYIDPAAYSSSSTSDLFTTRLCVHQDLLSKLICVSRQKGSAMEAMGMMTVLTKVVICTSR
jgi:hypothetical protein